MQRSSAAERGKMEVAFSQYDTEVTRFTVPLVREHALKTLRELFNNSAGSYTEFAGNGSWRGEVAPIAIFDVAGLPWQAVQRAAEIILLSGEIDVYVQIGPRAYWFNQAGDPSVNSRHLVETGTTGKLAAPVANPEYQAPLSSGCRKIQPQTIVNPCSAYSRDHAWHD